MPDEIEVVADCNFPRPTPSAVPLVPEGFGVRQILYYYFARFKKDGN
ncbi:MAG: hypothetical protein ACUVQK_11995 [Thermogutta sp.]